MKNPPGHGLGYTVTVECFPEDTPLEGNVMVTDDPDLDREAEEKVRAQLEHTEWAWCGVQVMVTLDKPCSGCGQTIRECSYLGCVSVAGEEDFVTNGGYYDDMVAECLEALKKTTPC